MRDPYTGNTLLHTAILEKKILLYRYFIKCGSNKYIPNYQNKSIQECKFDFYKEIFFKSIIIIVLIVILIIVFWFIYYHPLISIILFSILLYVILKECLYIFLD